MYFLADPDPRAVLVVPETDWAALDRHGRKVVLAQSTAFLTSTCPGDGWRDHGVESVLAVSRSVAGSVAAHFGMDSTVIPPSVDIDTFRPGPKEPSIVFMARKNWPGAERILARARTSGFALRPIDGLSRGDVARELGRASIALLASPSEGFGLFALEAMASGCLLVGFAGGGGLEFMRDGENCLLAPDGDETRAAELLRLAVNLVARSRHGKLVRRGIATARLFSPERERHAVLRFWRTFLAANGMAG